MPHSSGRPYSDVFAALAFVYLEDSWVLGVSAATKTCEFRLDAVLTPEHPRYRAPRTGEQYCYVPGTLSLTSTSDIVFERDERPSARDSTGEPDWGNIDVFRAVDEDSQQVWELEGSWGRLVVVEPEVLLVLGH